MSKSYFFLLIFGLFLKAVATQSKIDKEIPSLISMGLNNSSSSTSSIANVFGIPASKKIKINNTWQTIFLMPII